MVYQTYPFNHTVFTESWAQAADFGNLNLVIVPAWLFYCLLAYFTIYSDHHGYILVDEVRWLIITDKVRCVAIT